MEALAQLLCQVLRHADADSAVVFRSESFGDAPVIGIVGMHGEDPGQALAAGVGCSDKMRMRALGQEQVGLHPVEKGQRLLGVALQRTSAADAVHFDREALEALEDRGVLWIRPKVVQVQRQGVA